NSNCCTRIRNLRVKGECHSVEPESSFQFQVVADRMTWKGADVCLHSQQACLVETLLNLQFEVKARRRSRPFCDVKFAADCETVSGRELAADLRPKFVIRKSDKNVPGGRTAVPSVGSGDQESSLHSCRSWRVE